MMAALSDVIVASEFTIAGAGKKYTQDRIANPTVVNVKTQLKVLARFASDDEDRTQMILVCAARFTLRNRLNPK